MFIDKEKKVGGVKLWNLQPSPVKEILPLCRLAAAEGSVLLKNENATLPLTVNERISVFGRLQNTYYKSGTGSGGMVNIEKAPSILESLRNETDFIINEKLVKIYEEWIEENPFDYGSGWSKEPWSQIEMPVSDEIVLEAKECSDTAIIIIGRSAGEDHDNKNEKGSYKLTDIEELMIEKVAKTFSRTVVILNVGNLIDLSFMDKYSVSAVIYVWQGGMEGANAIADILSGKVAPCGKLPDTQAYSVEDYPSDKNFGNESKNFYVEDIYVGYRYFETFEENKVRYPFGFGLTYTNFKIDYTVTQNNESITVLADVTNIGNRVGKETVQIYYGAPCGKLGTPAKQLIGYAKTKLISPQCSERLEISFKIEQMASYDDNGATGNPFCYVLESGKYKIFAGCDVRTSQCVYEYNQSKTIVVKHLEQIMPPTEKFERFSSVEDSNGRRTLKMNEVLESTFNIEERVSKRRPSEIPFTGDMGIKLVDVAMGRADLDAFISQMSDIDLANIVCGEGMNSPKVTMGTGGAFGGVTDSLLDFGIPVCCVTDGPSGIRLDSGAKATSLPNGAVFASLFDDELTEKVFELVGAELFSYNIDVLLGPGMNIHRHPLNGRNFEYFSEDPYLSGKVAAAICRGIAKSGCSATIKHFCCNNQEFNRRNCEAVVSERALREIYLKGFEIAVKEGNAAAVMTAYNPVNGYWTASNYDLNTTVLRNEWGYKGFVMTDWLAKCNCFGEDGNYSNLKAMIRAQNDVYMICPDASAKKHNILSGIEEGFISRGELQRCAKNILNYIITSPTFLRFVDGGCKRPVFEYTDEELMTEVLSYKNIETDAVYKGIYGGIRPTLIIFEISCNNDILAQNVINLKIDSSIDISISLNGTDGKTVRVKRYLSILNYEHSLSCRFNCDVQIKSITIKSEL